MGKIAVIRMKGKFSVSPDVKGTLSCLRLDRLYACTLLEDNEISRGMLQACKDVVSFGSVDEATVALLLERRGRTAEGKTRLSAAKKPDEMAKIASELSSSAKKLSDFGAKQVFYLSPPSGGFGKRNAKAPFGPCGKNPGISELIARMA